MSIKVSVSQLRNRLPELLDRIVKSGEQYVVQRDGRDCAVLVSASQWRRRTVAERLDALGPDYRLARANQARAEALLAKSKQKPLSATEQRELRVLLQKSEKVMLRRAEALDHFS